MKQKLVIRTNVNPVPAKQSVSYEWHWRRIWAVVLSFVVVIGAGTYALLLSANADEVQEIQTSKADRAHLATTDNDTDAINSLDVREAYDEGKVELATTDNDTDAINSLDVREAYNEGKVELAMTDNDTDAISSLDVREAYNEDTAVNAQEVIDTTADHQTEVITLDVTDAYSEEKAGTDTLNQTSVVDERVAEATRDLTEERSEAADGASTETMTQQVLSEDHQTESISMDVSEAYQEEPATRTEVVSQKQFAHNATIANVARGAKIDTDKISRAVLTTRVMNKEPIDVLKSDVSNTQFNEKIYFFTEVNNLQGNVIHHMWYYQDVLQADIKLTIAAARYRTYSLKHVNNEQVGDWRVEVVTETGDLLARKEFRIHAAKP